ncbi:hypothetical protein KIH07_16885 [Hydrogenophaga taeniospiralis]|uniref:hypothetical protein n=1 Tax=Hydrogenophaga taeniospiralis TaxID=65656 RepID=UPI001CFAC7AE|nr:hypothetical protein [Hydrogenophaga taeniospiralis]MCB4365421.1 hypothetical protein [Hydrogenophaga taeniospiralis]
MKKKNPPPARPAAFLIREEDLARARAARATAPEGWWGKTDRRAAARAMARLAIKARRRKAPAGAVRVFVLMAREARRWGR